MSFSFYEKKSTILTSAISSIAMSDLGMIVDAYSMPISHLTIIPWGTFSRDNVCLSVMRRRGWDWKVHGGDLWFWFWKIWILWKRNAVIPAISDDAWMGPHFDQVFSKFFVLWLMSERWGENWWREMRGKNGILVEKIFLLYLVDETYQ